MFIDGKYTWFTYLPQFRGYNVHIKTAPVFLVVYLIDRIVRIPKDFIRESRALPLASLRHSIFSALCSRNQWNNKQSEIASTVHLTSSGKTEDVPILVGRGESIYMRKVNRVVWRHTRADWGSPRSSASGKAALRYFWTYCFVRCLDGGGGWNPTFVIRQRPLIWVILNPNYWLGGILEIRLPWNFYRGINQISGKSIELWDWIKQKKMIKNNDRWKTSWSPPTIPSSEGDEILLTFFPSQKNLS